MKKSFQLDKIYRVKYVPQKTLFLIVVMAYVAFTAFFAEHYIVSQRFHKHDRHGAEGTCSVCSELERAQLLLESLGRIRFIAQAAGCIAYAKNHVTKPALVFSAAPTLVSLKIRFNY